MAVIGGLTDAGHPAETPVLSTLQEYCSGVQGRSTMEYRGEYRGREYTPSREGGCGSKTAPQRVVRAVEDKWVLIYLLIIPYRTVPYRNVPYRTIPYHTVPYHTIPREPVPWVATTR